VRQVKFYKGLRFKIIVGLISLLTLTMTILFTVQYFHHRKKMIYNLQENISPHLTQMVNDVLKSSMLSKNKDEMKYILEAVQQYPDVKNIFILNRIGRIIISINDRDMGRIINIRDSTCQVCHHGATKALNKTVIYSSSEGEKIFRNVNPIYIRKECFSCHKPEEKIAGVLVTDFTLNNIEKQLRAELKENLLFLFFAIGISTLVIGIALNQLVLKKLRHFVEAASLFGRGDFKGTISFKSDDEIKKLADSFNQMAKTVTEKMRLERTYLSRIIETQENERRRISRELHDEIGQALYAIQFNLEMIDKDLPQTTSLVRERLGEAKSLSSQTLTAMRQLSLDLRPTMLDDLGLVPTLRWYVQNFSNRLNICSTFEAMGFEEKLPPQIETAFYRIVQEALNNIAKHARANRVEISLVKRDWRIFASIQDNGSGFDLSKVLHPESPERGFGIVGIQERVSLLGGQLDIQTRPGFGTLIRIEIPYESGRDGHEKNTRSIGRGPHDRPPGNCRTPSG
jgi:two-component system sensor histidine kinase UhpB